jgi:predicted ATPase/DNA-binding SARP family transcriptional activator
MAGRTDRTPGDLCYGVLGPTAAWDAGSGQLRPVVGHQGTLLARLLVEHGRAVPSDRLVHAVWGDDLPKDPGAALRSQIARLRRRLCHAGDLVTTTAGYRLDVVRDKLDATRFEDLAAEAARIDDDRRAVELLDEGLALWRGPALDGIADRDFAHADAVRLEALRITAREQRAERLLVLDSLSEALSDLEVLVVEHPERERARGLLMEALYRSGRHREAIDAYQTWRRELAEQGLEPAPDLKRLEYEVLAHSLTRRVRPRRGIPPKPVSSFVGRERDVAEVAQMVKRGARLVTLCGPGGVGKTRLALEVVGRIPGGEFDAICHCDLSAISRGVHVTRAVTHAVGIHEVDSRTPDEQLLKQLATTRLLIVLDNCEHVLHPVARLAEQLLHHTRDVRILATSREPLGVGGEHVRTVVPLATVGDLSPAVRLFLDRARTAGASVDAAGDDLVGVASMCRRLDGLPLAIELAAARLRGLTIGELSAELQHRPFDVLDQGSRTAPRHHSLRTVIDWSYDLLAPADRDTFDGLSVFAGPFDMAAAAAVVGGDGPGGRVTPRVLHLVDRSLLVAERGTDATTYRMLETLRSYGHDRLRARGGLGVVRSRHSRWAIHLAEEASEALRGPEEPAWVAHLQDHLADVRAAHEWLVGHEPDAALRLSSALHAFAMWRGQAEIFRWSEVAAGAASGSRSPFLPLVLSSAATGAWQRGDLQAAQGAVQAAATVAGQAGELGMRRVREVTADIKLVLGELDVAIDLFQEAYRPAIAHGDLPQAVWDIGSVALAHTYAGRPAEAEGPAEEAWRLAERCGSPSARSFAEFTLGEIAVATHRGGEDHLRRALELAERADCRFVAGLARVTLATAHGRTRDLPEALDHYGRVIAQWQEAGMWTPQLVTLRNLVEVLARHGDPAEAATLYGAVTSRVGAPAFGADAVLLRKAHQRLRSALGDRAFGEHTKHGATLDRDDVISAALAAIEHLRSSRAAARPG